MLSQIVPKAVVKGAISFLPFSSHLTCRHSGGTTSARYCYSVWLRHLIRCQEVKLSANLNCVGELGPGDSLGIGLAALLSGANVYYAFDAKAHSGTRNNLRVLDE